MSLKIYIDDSEADINEDTKVSLSWKLEDKSNFQEKQSSSALNITLPTTLQNDITSNTFHNPSIEDLTSGEAFKAPRKALIEASGYEVLAGKAFLTEATHTDVPEDYTYDFYGDNADWMVDLQDVTLFDLLKDLQFLFVSQTITDSWLFDGRDRNLSYVFAPVRYGQSMDPAPANYIQQDPPIIQDYSMPVSYMRPSFSVYWILFRMFQKAGYRISSVFFDTDYFRRLVMPWVWGNFLYSDGTQTDNLRFLAKTAGEAFYADDSFGNIIDLNVSNDNINGGFDANNSYQYDDTNLALNWTYLPAFSYGTLEVHFHVQTQHKYTATKNGQVEARIQWFKNGQRITTGNVGETSNGDKIFDYNAPTLVGGDRDTEILDFRQAFTVDPGDVITAKFFGHIYKGNSGVAHFSLEVLTYEIEYFRVPTGGTIYMSNYLALKKYKALDLLAGIVDCFNLIPKTDSISKTVLIEPEHAYSLTADATATIPGYHNGDFVNWNDKQDVKKKSTVTLFRDSNRELVYKFKDDSSDGILKLIQDRNANTCSAAKYVLPERFTNDKSEVENRFFSPVMHWEVPQWKDLGPNGPPQMVVMVPENISNTSRDEAQNTFNPKLCYYKGLTPDYGWIYDGSPQSGYPFMFAVNYKPGGENDPVLSYCDEAISGGIIYLVDDQGNYIVDDQGGKIVISNTSGQLVTGKGFLRRFYLQRMAIMRNGQYYSTFIRLKNIDFASSYHREHKIVREERWELTEIKNYDPENDQSVECDMRKWSPVTQKDSDSVFPSMGNVAGTAASASGYEMKYWPAKCLSSDVKVSV